MDREKKRKGYLKVLEKTSKKRFSFEATNFQNGLFKRLRRTSEQQQKEKWWLGIRW